MVEIGESSETEDESSIVVRIELIDCYERDFVRKRLEFGLKYTSLDKRKIMGELKRS